MVRYLTINLTNGKILSINREILMVRYLTINREILMVRYLTSTRRY